MRITIALMFAAAAAAAAPALAQETNDAASTAAPADNVVAAPANDMMTVNTMTANDVVLAPGEATTATPVAPAEPVGTETPDRDRGGGFPWGLLGLLGLIGLLGRSRRTRDAT